MQETCVWSQGQEDPLEKEIATHSSILAWEIPWTEEPSRLQSTGSKGVGHDFMTKHQHDVIFHQKIIWLVTTVGPLEYPDDMAVGFP